VFDTLTTPFIFICLYAPIRNELREVPDLSGLMALQSLDLSENHLSSVPLLPASDALNQIFLGFNYLTHVDGLSHVRGLSTIDLRDNKITSLPADLSKLPQLKVRPWMYNS
jgi:Leucine-rich repeat (LRR) protein